MSVSTKAIFDEISNGFGASRIEDPYPVFAERRHTTPVMAGDITLEMGLPSFAAANERGRAFTLFRYEDISETLRRADIFTTELFGPMMEPLLGPTILSIDGDEHRRWRGLLGPVFTPRAVDAWRERMIEPVARELAAELARGRRADLVEFALRFPVRMIYEIIGVSGDPDEFEDFQAKALSLLLATSADPDPALAERTMRNFERGIEASRDLFEMLLGVVERRRGKGDRGADLISHLIDSEFEGDQFSDGQIAGFVRTLLLAATDNTSRLFLNTMVCLLERPELRGAASADPGLLGAAVTEAARYQSPTTFGWRYATRDVEIRGVRLPAGSTVVLALASGNRDEATFPEAATFDVSRRGRPPLTFGFGPHICLGMATAKAEIISSIKALCELLPGLRLDPECPPPRIVGGQFRGPRELAVTWG